MENEATALILCFASIGLCIALYGLYVLQTCSPDSRAPGFHLRSGFQFDTTHAALTSSITDALDSAPLVCARIL